MSIPATRLMWHVYVRKGTTFVPDVAKTEAGFFLDVDPVRVANLHDVPSLAAAIEQAMANENRQIPTPTRAEFPKPVILQPAGLRNWKAFVRGGACFTIVRSEAAIEIAETGRNDDGEWVDAPSANVTLPAGQSAVEIAKCIADRAATRSDLA